MGNYCSTGKKKDGDTASTKSDDSQYTLNEKNKKNKGSKGAPLADPEPISDISAHNTNAHSPNPVQNETIIASQSNPSPPTTPVVLKSYPKHLQPLLGKLSADQQVAKEKKIVLYVLSAQNDSSTNSALNGVYQKMRGYCASRGFELVLSNLHTDSSSVDLNLFEERKWLAGPLEAQGSEHALSVNCTSEITRQSRNAYMVPVLVLGNSLGTPLIPLTIESQDFESALVTAEKAGKVDGKQLLLKWYSLDNKAQPACYRLKPHLEDVTSEEARLEDLKRILCLFVEIFTKDLKNSYLTTVVELEINNTILMSPEQTRRCVWIKSTQPVSQSDDATDVLMEENTRRLNILMGELKKILSDKNVMKLDKGKLEDVAGTLETTIKTHIDLIVEEHTAKNNLIESAQGVPRKLYEEMENVAKLSHIYGQSGPSGSALEDVKKYLLNPSTHPLIIHGVHGSGKTLLVAKLAQSIHAWLPDCCLALRFGGLTRFSQDIPSVLESIVHQIGHIQSKSIPLSPHTSKAYGESLKALIEITEIPIVIVLDSVDQIGSTSELDWIPKDLPVNVKIILTVAETENGNQILSTLKESVKSDNIIQLSPFTDVQWKEVLSRGTMHFPEEWSDSKEKMPIHAKLLSWMAWLGVKPTQDNSVEGLTKTVFEILEQKLTKDVVAQIFALILVRPLGVLESEITDQLSQLATVKDSEVATQLWLHFCWIIGPLLLHTNITYIMDTSVANAARDRYPSEISTAHERTRQYYEDQPSQFVDPIAQKYTEVNRRKCELLPWNAFKAASSSFASSFFVTDLEWISKKIQACGAGALLRDLSLVKGTEAHVDILVQMCENDFLALNYDEVQFYAVLKSNLGASGKSNEVTEKWQQQLQELSSLALEEVPSQENSSGSEGEVVQYDKLIALKSEKGYFVVSISTSRAELVVWDVVKCKKVRTLTKVPQPTDLCQVGEFGVAVLCGREIKVLDLNDGCFKVTLKGVMNQKMPYFGLHDSGHLVCLSRNRMYVNLMNLESGDCVTTFKAGEDRFLNSLLVAGDGRMLVCGDETQKPFPLLVWHLTQRKLLYDLRIPHHDFITSLSAITHEGSYVCVVAKELDEPAPNFIVVYDLQSGTLFKKWKPACDTVALAISQTQTCVIAGLEDSRILVWDLVTGNCKLKLLGHTAPVTRLQLDPTGKILLSGDKESRDFSIRLWDLSTGNQLAVYTPPAKITTCEILSEGRFIILALENRSHLVTLELKPLNQPVLEDVEETSYGKAENEGQIYDITPK